MTELDKAEPELPDGLRAPLHSLQADLDCLFERMDEGPDVRVMIKDSIRNRLSQIEEAAYRLQTAEREKIAGWMIAHSFATGHGDTIEELLEELGAHVDRLRDALKAQMEATTLALRSSGYTQFDIDDCTAQARAALSGEER